MDTLRTKVLKAVSSVLGAVIAISVILIVCIWPGSTSGR